MDVEILARFQFALTIMFHYIYPPLSIGLGVIMVIIEAISLKTGLKFWRDVAKFWTKVFALTFAIGVATGIVMEFEFGTNWSTYSRYVGDVFGSALAAEGVFAFMLESGFLALLLFGWDRVSAGVHFFATCMVALGAHFSAIWIIVANSWMQTPAGFEVVGEGLKAKAHITDFWAMVFNPSSMTRLTHAVIAAWLAGAFLVISISAWYLLKKKHQRFAIESLKIGMIVATISLVLQGFSGHHSASGVARNQPAKMAALEGVYETQKDAPLTIFGFPDSEAKKVRYAVELPSMLSILAFGSRDAEIIGLDQYPRKDWPYVPMVFQMYHLMLAMWAFMTISVILTWVWWKKGKLLDTPWLLRIMAFSVILPQIGNQAGWICCEMGRYPWIVQGLLRISEGLSKSVTANQVATSIVMFGLLYICLFILFIYLLNEKIKHGPDGGEPDDIYPQLEQAVEGNKK